MPFNIMFDWNWETLLASDSTPYAFPAPVTPYWVRCMIGWPSTGDRCVSVSGQDASIADARMKTDAIDFQMLAHLPRSGYRWR